MSFQKENPYLEAELRHLMKQEVEVEAFIKLHTMIAIRGVITSVNVNDRNPSFTMRSLHKGQVKNNIIALNNFATINYVGEE